MKGPSGDGPGRPMWLGNASLDEQIAGSLWGRLAKGLQKDHAGGTQASSATAVVQEWLLRGGNARALTYAVWCEVMLRAIKQNDEAQRPASGDSTDDDMSDDDVSELFRTCRPSASSDVSVSSQATRGRVALGGMSPLPSATLDAAALVGLRWLERAWCEYPLEKPDQEADRLRLFAVVKCLGQEQLGWETRGVYRTVLDLCPLPALVKLAFADVRERFLGRIVGREGRVNGDLNVFVEAQARQGVVSVLQLDRYADVRNGRLEHKTKKTHNIIPLATAAEQSLRRVDTFPFRAPNPLEVQQIQARIATAKDRGQLYVLLSNRLSQGHARAAAGLEDGLLVMEWVLDFFEETLPVCKPEPTVARSICYTVHGVKRAIDTTDTRDGAENLISTLEKIEGFLAESAAAPERNELALDGRPLSEFEKLNAKYMDQALTRIDSLPSFLVRTLQLSEIDSCIESRGSPDAAGCESADVAQLPKPEILAPISVGSDSAAERVSCDGSATEGDSDEEPQTLDAAYGMIERNRKNDEDGNAKRTGNGFVLVSEESLEAANSASDEPSSPPAWLLRKQRSLNGIPPERTESGLERAWKSTVQIDAGSWDARPVAGLHVRVRRNKSLLEREYLPDAAASPSARALRSKGIAKRSVRSPKKMSYLTAAALRGVIKSTEGAPLEEFEAEEGAARGRAGATPKFAAQAFDLQTERRAAQIGDEMEEDPVTPSFFTARRKGAAIAARLPRSGVRREWMALKLVRERAAAASFARRQLAKSQQEKERRKAAAGVFASPELKAESSDGSFADGHVSPGQRTGAHDNLGLGGNQPGGWEPTAEESHWEPPPSSSGESKGRHKRVTWAETCVYNINGSLPVEKATCGLETEL